VSAFTTPSSSVVSGTRSSTTVKIVILKLHPDQAPELAACAYTLMKQQQQQQAKQQERKVQLLSQDISKKLHNDEQTAFVLSETSNLGPMSWARKRLQQRFGQNMNQAPRQTDVMVSLDAKSGMMP
jgi:ABC-type dipeptide/oligopeptide/nickel transport system ATPase subunit